MVKEFEARTLPPEGAARHLTGTTAIRDGPFDPSIHWMRTMNKGQLIDQVAERTGLPRPTAVAIVRSLFDPHSGIIAGELSEGGSVALPGFGRFETRNRPARTARDPRTGKEIQVGARRACVFTPRKGLRRSLKDMVGA